MNHFKILLAAAICTIAGTIISQPSRAQQKPIPVDTTYNVARVHRQISAAYPYAVPAIDSMTAAIKSERNIVYATLEQTAFGKRELHLDVFRPTENKKLPAVIMIHGGGWRSAPAPCRCPWRKCSLQKDL